MTNLNTIQQVEKLVSQLADNDARKDTDLMLARLSNQSLVKEVEEFNKDYQSLLMECQEAESLVTDSTALTQRLISTSAAVESLTDDLCDAKESIGKLENESLSMAGLQRQIAEKNIEIKSLNAYKRKAEVLAKELKAMEANYQNARTKQANPGKSVKSSLGARKLEAKLNEADKVIAGYASHYLVSPQFEGDYQHSKQGVISLYRLNPVLMTIDRNGDGAEDVKVERMILMNSYNSCKVITRIAGENQLGHVSLPKGCTISVDDEMMGWSVNRFKENDSNIAQLKNQRRGK